MTATLSIAPGWRPNPMPDDRARADELIALARRYLAEAAQFDAKAPRHRAEAMRLQAEAAEHTKQAAEFEKFARALPIESAMWRRLFRQATEAREMAMEARMAIFSAMELAQQGDHARNAALECRRFAADLRRAS